MKKITDKVSLELRNDEVFLKRINRLVYNRVEPYDFEAQWLEMMLDYDHANLRHNKWLKSMYEIRKMWVSAYFREIYMGGLFGTTSRSESENNFFHFL